MSSPREYYKEQMSSWLNSSKLPPTNWELRDKHKTVEQEAVKQCPETSNSILKKEITKEFNEVQKTHRLMREESLINSVLGRKNYVNQIPDQRK